jgi:hypothetical protein
MSLKYKRNLGILYNDHPLVDDHQPLLLHKFEEKQSTAH